MSSAPPKGPRLGVTMWCAVGLLLSCGSRREEVRSIEPPPVPSGAVATLGDWTVTPEMLPPEGRNRDTLGLLLRDARLASHSLQSSPDRAAVVQRGVLVRALVEQLAQRSLRRSSPTPDEESAIREERWEEIDRPRAVRSGYAYLPFRPLTTGDAEFEVMERVASAVSNLPGLNRFGPTVLATAGDALVPEIGQAPPLTADGRVVTRGVPIGEVAIPPEPFAREVNRLQRVGETTPVIATGAGVFVAIATEIVPPQKASSEEAQEIVRRGIEAARVEPSLTALQERAQAEGLVRVSPKHKTLTRLVWREE